ncbi:MAG TPA: diguanylate cyclase [Terracidiphilus sp.]|nr:diguanylate cyclase [Terracidiphilus sp.]
MRLFLGCALLLSAGLAAPAQRYSFRAYTDGLDNLNISALVQDHTGYLWVGTESGLYRYNGKTFHRYGEDQGIHERVIRTVYVSQDGTIWVATDTSLYFEAANGRFTKVALPVSRTMLFPGLNTAMTSKSRDQIVVATQRGAFLISRVAADNWTATPMHLQGTVIWSVLYARDGSLWYGCDSDLCRLKDGVTTHERARMGLPEDQWNNLMLTTSGQLWIRSRQHIAELEPGTDSFEMRDVPGDLPAGPAQELVEDAQGRILASQGSVFGIWTGDHWRIVDQRNGLPHIDISKLFVDRDGSVWIGLVGHGLLLWLGEDRWQGYTNADGLSNDTVWAMARDGASRLWVGTDSGLDYFPSNGNTPVAWHQSGIGTGQVVALAKAPDGAMWIGTQQGSVARINPGTLIAQQWKVPEVYRMLVDTQKRLWIATAGGLYVVDTLARGEAPHLFDGPSLPAAKTRFTNLCLDPQGGVWTTSEQGVFHLDQNKWVHIDTGTLPIRPDVIAVDGQGNLWMADSSRNLMKLQLTGNSITSTQTITRPELLSEQVVALMVDSRGWLWVGQDAGVSVYDGHSWRSFTKDDGLIWNDVNSDSLMEDQDGSIWIGTTGGLSHLLQPHFASAQSQPPLVFEQAAYNGAPLTEANKVKWSGGPMVISMASLAFHNTLDAGIRYRLVGDQGTGWEDTEDMTVRFRHLAPGNYRFEAESVDAAGNAVSPVSTFSFRIEPSWWQNSVVQSSFGLLALLLILIIWRLRVGHLMGQKRRLEQAVQMRTEDLEQEKIELVRAREQMRYCAEHDGLTAVWNHRIIVQRLSDEVNRSMREGKPLSILLVDLDHFKKINDTFGHRAGDETLKHVSALFQGMVRSYDWVGRYGGEEFLLILPGASFENARLRAEEMRLTVEQSDVEAGDRRIPITASFGVISGFPDNYETMIQAADAALYHAKNSGRNCVVAKELKQRESELSSAKSSLN